MLASNGGRYKTLNKITGGVMDLNELKEPFPAEDIEWRIQQAGSRDGKVWAKVLAYVTNRAIMNRLDEVCGQENWKNDFREWIGGSVLCGLSIKINNEWVTKWDGADTTDFEATKGGLSGAMKRAAVQWGIGRYLYNLESYFANVHDKGIHYQPADKKNNKYPAFKWDEPELPAWALPAEDGNRIETMLRLCTNLNELKEVWASLTKQEQAKYLSLKDEIKKKFEEDK
jgi:hypothetical protein